MKHFDCANVIRKKNNWNIILLFVFLAVGQIKVNAAPTVNGLFYGDGDENQYVLYNTSIGGSKLWYTVYGNTLYVALVVDRSVNDNVFAPKTNKEYNQSAGWENHRDAKRLTDSEFAEFSLTVGDASYT